MLLITLLKGVAVGIVIALPVGPVGMLCVRRTLFEGILFGLLSGLGAALADALFGVIAGLGLSAVRDEILAWRHELGAAGGVFLVYAGIRALLQHPPAAPEPLAGEKLFGAFASAFALTLTNPITILAFAAIFARVGIDAAAHWSGIGVLVGGVFLGSALWWVGLAVGVAWLRRMARGFSLGWLSHLSGAILSLSGLGLIAAALLGRV
ncbi:MAG TPA: LysE family transporter [Stellaceae bacterium]|nr:LysE family transporter [Stellaceae bacterium]